MTIFFLLIGLELRKRNLSRRTFKLKDALLPIFGAIGGMFVPAGIFLMFNYGTQHNQEQVFLWRQTLLLHWAYYRCWATECRLH
jgi:Na+/H+ antiporter NhaA